MGNLRIFHRFLQRESVNFDDLLRFVGIAKEASAESVEKQRFRVEAFRITHFWLRP